MPTMKKATLSGFEPARIKRWRRDVYRVFEGDGFKPPQIMAALVLAAISTVGTDPRVLSELTGHSEEYIRRVLTRLRKQRVLRGQTLRGAWADDRHGSLAIMLDGMVAAGMVSRFVDEKRSAAQKARAPETRARGPRGKRAVVAPGAVFTPQVQKSNPLYGLPEWEAQNQGKGK